MKTNLKKSLLALWVAFMIGLTACGSTSQVEPPSTSVEPITQSQTETAGTTASDQTLPTDSSSYSTDISDLPVYSGEPYVPINNNIPAFTDSDFTTTSFEHYSELDSLGRCGVAFANVGQDLMPTEERGSIGQVKPTGWHTVKYSHVDGQYLYNRCHLLGFQLTAENANVKNLITGTRYLNVTGMLPFENMVADYIKETNNHHVLYRVTPIFEGNNLVANGVQMEAMSVEDRGEGIEFNVFCYNVQPGITIDYATGESHEDGTNTTASSASNNTSSSSTQTTTAPAVVAETNQATAQQDTSSPTSSSSTFILNTNTKKFHLPSCSSIKRMKDSNKKEFSGSRDEVIAQGYEPCKKCNP